MDLFGLSIATVPAIVAFVYSFIECAKIIYLNAHEEYKKLIPMIAGVVGAILGIMIWVIDPSLIASESWYGALITGVVSGLSAVGVNQIGKQLKKD